MILRLATIDDIFGMAKLFKEFAGEGLEAYGLEFDLNKSVDVVAMLIQQHICVTVELEGQIVGGLAGMVVPSIYSKDKIFQEVFFYTLEDFRVWSKNLLKYAEKICKERGIVKMVMAHPISDCSVGMDRFYSLMRYKPLEKHYIKSLCK